MKRGPLWRFSASLRAFEADKRAKTTCVKPWEARKSGKSSAKKDGRALEFAAEELKGDPKIVMKAVTENGCALQHAPLELQGNHKIVMRAVSHGNALQFAAKELQGDREIVMRAVSKDARALQFATEVGVGRRGLVAKGSFTKMQYPDIPESIEVLESLQNEEKEGESEHLLRFLENLEVVEFLNRASSEKDPLL